MTEEELRKTANELGYSVIKKKPYIRLTKCRCGKWPVLDRRYPAYKDRVRYYCPRCDIVGEWAAKGVKGSYTRRIIDPAKLAWNKTLEETEDE